MMNETNSLQSPGSPLPYQPSVTNSYQSPVGQQPLSYQPLPSYQSPVGQQPLPYQSPEGQLPLRTRYTPEQIRLYFFPYPDRGPKIHQLKQKLGTLYKQVWVLVLAGLILAALLIGSAGQGITYLGLLEFVCIIGSVVLITRLVKTKLLPLREELYKELADEAKENEHTRRLQPPNERQYDEWITALSDDIYEKAPGGLHLHEHPDHKAWKKAVISEHYTPLPEEPEEFGASLYLEGRIASSNEANERPPQLKKLTNDSVRIEHYSVYVFTALFITEDYVAIYTNTVNLCDSTRDREEFEYCYHQHLSHMSLNVDTTLLNIHTQPPRQIAFKDSSLSLTFDSGLAVERNISTLHIGNQSINNIANIHEKLTKALVDHERSMTRSIKETKNLE